MNLGADEHDEKFMLGLALMQQLGEGRRQTFIGTDEVEEPSHSR